MAEDTTINWEAINAFAKRYWLSRHPEIQVIEKMPSVNSPGATQAALQERAAKCRELSDKGYDIDPVIDLFGAHPWVQMTRRVQYPGIEFYLNGKPIVGSVDPADYPPFEKPAPPASADMTVVGFNIAPGLWPKDRYTAGVKGDDEYADGNTYEDERGMFIKRVVKTMVGVTHYWERQ